MMHHRRFLVPGVLILVAFLAWPQSEALPDPGQPEPAKATRPWTRQEALAQLKLYPRDAYLQYVALQLSRRESDNQLNNTAQEIDALLVADDPFTLARERTRQVDLFSIFSGALAVQESLQL